MKKAVALMIVAVMMFASFGTAHAEAVPFPGTPVIGIAWRGDTDSEFFTNICKAEGLPNRLHTLALKAVF